MHNKILLLVNVQIDMDYFLYNTYFKIAQFGAIIRLISNFNTVPIIYSSINLIDFSFSE